MGVIDLQIDNERGVMKSKSILDVRMRMRVSRIGPFAHLVVPCHVLDMADPIVLRLSASKPVSGAQLGFFISDNAVFE